MDLHEIIVLSAIILKISPGRLDCVFEANVERRVGSSTRPEEGATIGETV
jgi:hypothetical protein